LTMPLSPVEGGSLQAVRGSKAMRAKQHSDRQVGKRELRFMGPPEGQRMP
jgi:hypothetical protein